VERAGVSRRTGLPPLLLAAEYRRRFDNHDLDGLNELRTDSFAVVDHRTHRWEASDALVADEQWRSEFGSPDVRIEMDELLACDERVIALLGCVRGTAPDDGREFELRFGAVDVVEDGLVVSVELYDPDERQAMLARYGALGGT
jgi:hypothetical protein